MSLPDYITVTAPIVSYGVPAPIVPLCRNCRFWGAFSGDPEGFCNSPKLSVRKLGVENIAADELVSDFDSDGEDAIHTGPDFGCVHFEAKE